MPVPYLVSLRRSAVSVKVAYFVIMESGFRYSTSTYHPRNVLVSLPPVFDFPKGNWARLRILATCRLFLSVGDTKCRSNRPYSRLTGTMHLQASHRLCRHRLHV